MHTLRSAFFWDIALRTGGNSLPTFRDNVSGPTYVDFLTFEDGSDRLSRNVGNYHYTLGNDPEERRMSSAFAAEA
jgi:hypothetical protein